MKKPEILLLKNKAKISKLKSDKTIKVVDFFDSQIAEMQKIDRHSTEKLEGVWVYYPWSKLLVRLLDKENFRKVRLSRNKNLITEDEQKRFSQFVIGIAGLNVGNPGAICITLEGGAEKMKFADNDGLELSNFNRFRASLKDLGLNKAVLSAEQVYEIDPFYDIEVFENGLSEKNIDEFLNGPKIDLLIEEMDNLPLKIMIREKAKSYRIPVLMVTGNEAGLIIDVERFDLDEDLSLLSGHLKNEVIQKIGKIDEIHSVEEKINLARNFMGREFLTDRMNESFDQVGKSLAGIPQISESTFLRGAVLSYYSRQIAVGKNINSGRYFLNLADIKND